MAIFSVFEPPVTGNMRLAKAVVIKDGFSLIAFIAPLIWFLWHRMWLEALGVLVISAVLGGLSMIPGLEVVPALGILVAFFIGMEARNLRINALLRSGWKEWGVVVAASQDEAELRYMDEALGAGEDNQSGFISEAAEPRAHVSRPTAATPIFGLIDYPRKA